MRSEMEGRGSDLWVRISRFEIVFQSAKFLCDVEFMGRNFGTQSFRIMSLIRPQDLSNQEFVSHSNTTGGHCSHRSRISCVCFNRDSASSLAFVLHRVRCQRKQKERSHSARLRCCSVPMHYSFCALRHTLN